MKIVRNILRIITSFVIAIVLLSMVSMLYKHTSPHISSIANETYYRWEKNSFTSTMNEGFAWINMDQNGYNNLSCFDVIDILILGSSHMEAVQIRTEDNTASRLNDLIPYNTYIIGISSHSLTHCVNNLKAAIEVFEPREYVIIETSNVSLNIDDMNAVIHGQLLPSGSPDVGVKRLIQYVPAAKPILNQLLEWANVSGKGNEMAAVIGGEN